MEFTKEQLQQIEAAAKEVLWPVVWSEKKAREHFSEKITPQVVLKLARIALALHEAVPVAYADPQAFRNFQAGVARREWMWRNPGADLIPVYTAPPAPILPEEIVTAMEEVLSISDRDHEAWQKAKSAIAGFRAAMLNIDRK